MSTQLPYLDETYHNPINSMKTVALTAADIENPVMQAFYALPDLLRAEVGEIVFRVEEYRSKDHPIHGIAIRQNYWVSTRYRSTGQERLRPLPDVDMIFLYQRPLLDYWSETGEWNVLCGTFDHEIGHHFGFSDDDMKAPRQAEALGE